MSKRMKKWAAIASVGLAVMVLAALALPVAASEAVTTPVERWGGPGGGSTYLADALGISVDDLQAAEETAHEAAIQQAVDEGLITQAQADAILEHSGAFGFRGFRIPFVDMSGIDMDALLADALGVTTDELTAAREAAADATLAQAVEDGYITQEQADLMQARKALAEYLRDTGAYDAAVQQAVADGVITQEQADAILENSRGFFGGFDGMRGGRRGGMPGGEMPGGFNPGDMLQRFQQQGGMRGFDRFGGQSNDDSASPSGLFQRTAPAANGISL